MICSELARTRLIGYGADIYARLTSPLSAISLSHLCKQEFYVFLLWTESNFLSKDGLLCHITEVAILAKLIK